MLEPIRPDEYKEYLTRVLKKHAPPPDGGCALFLRHWEDDVYFPIMWTSASGYGGDMAYYHMPMIFRRDQFTSENSKNDVFIRRNPSTMIELLTYWRIDRLILYPQDETDIESRVQVIIPISPNILLVKFGKEEDCTISDSAEIDQLKMEIQFVSRSWYNSAEPFSGGADKCDTPDKVLKQLTDTFSDLEQDAPFWPFLAFRYSVSTDANRSKVEALNLLGWHCSFSRRIRDLAQQYPWVPEMPGKRKEEISQGTPGSGRFWREDLREHPSHGHFSPLVKATSERTIDYCYYSGKFEWNNTSWHLYWRINCERSLYASEFQRSFDPESLDLEVADGDVPALFCHWRNCVDALKRDTDNFVVAMGWLVQVDAGDDFVPLEEGNSGPDESSQVVFLGAVPGAKVHLLAKGILDNSEGKELAVFDELVYPFTAICLDRLDHSPMKDQIQSLLRRYLVSFEEALKRVSTEFKLHLQSYLTFNAKRTEQDNHDWDGQAKESPPSSVIGLCEFLNLKPSDFADELGFDKWPESHFVNEAIKGGLNCDRKNVSIGNLFFLLWGAYRLRLSDYVPRECPFFEGLKEAIPRYDSESSKPGGYWRHVVRNSHLLPGDSRNSIPDWEINAHTELMTRLTLPRYDSGEPQKRQLRKIHLCQSMGLTAIFELPVEHCRNLNERVIKKHEDVYRWYAEHKTTKGKKGRKSVQEKPPRDGTTSCLIVAALNATAATKFRGEESGNGYINPVGFDCNFIFPGEKVGIGEVHLNWNLTRK
ncbi:hypothetical protein ACYFX5_26860 [Bremerella sp. T1]|uniref:hypothetical protein n=1 Tax=Bremerella sp. TYQ1 TaxID=3119568 RepID=UPI001CCE0D8E|nr:hypothetical protein [Bremerella volcania]UBM36631.1 hypothetical protein LA756_01715 [Bremerella volcania]